MDDAAPAEYTHAPSMRELELEIMLKERDGYVKSLVDEVRALRRVLPQSERTYDLNEPVMLPPAATSLLLSLSRISKMQTAGAAGHGSSATVTAALSARLAALQTENDELYELLKKGTVAQLHEEVKQLRVVTKRMGSALSETHSVVGQLKAELEYAHRALKDPNGGGLPADLPRMFGRPPLQGPGAYRDGASGKTIPSGPRAQKRQRLDQTKRYDAPAPSPLMRRSNSREATPSSSRWGDDRGGFDPELASHEDVSQNEQTHTEYDQTLSRHSQTPPPRRYSPDDDRRGRSRTRSPPAHERAYQHLARDEPIRASSVLNSPRDFSYSPDPPSHRRSPARSPERLGGSTHGSHYTQGQDRRPASVGRSPSPPRRSRSPPRVKHRDTDSRQDRRRDDRSYRSGADRSRHGGYQNEPRRRSPIPDIRIEREKERERERSRPGSAGGSNSGARPRRRGPRNGTGNGTPSDLGRRYGQQGPSSNAGTLASRIQ